MALDSHYNPSQWDEESQNLGWVPGEPNFLQSTAGTSYPSHPTTTADMYQNSTYFANDVSYTTGSALPTTGYPASSSYTTYNTIGVSASAYMSPSAPVTSPAPVYHDNTYGDAMYSPGGTTLGAYTPSTVVDPSGVDTYQGENPGPPSYHLSQEAPCNNGARTSGTGFQCPSCEKSYPRRRDLDRHIHSRHPQVQSSASEYVTCPVCGRDNMRRDNWQRHMRQRHPTYRDTTHILPRPERPE